MKTDNEIKTFEEQVELGLKKSFEKLIEFKKKNNSPLIISRNGKVVAIPADEIDQMDEDSKATEL